MGATYKLKRKKADGTLEDVILQGAGGGGGGVPFIAREDITVNTGTGAIAEKWSTPNVGGVTTPTDGMTIVVRTPNRGSAYGIILSIDGGNNFYPLLQNKETRIATQHAEGSTLILTFNATVTSSVYLTGSGQTTVIGGWQTTDLDTNTQVQQYHTTTDDKYPLIFKYYSGVTSTSTAQAMVRYSNNIYSNPSTGTIYANDFVVGGQSIVGGPRKMSSDTTTINIQATTVGAYFNIIGNLAEANELAVGGNSISLDSERSHCVRVEGMLTGKGVSSPTTYYWRVMVTVSDDSATGAASTYTYYISTTSGFNISDTGQNGTGYCRYTGIFSE